ncbi:hypothetical protein CYMTET_42602 [Cymbomonas tetramitiformis]|uniref:Uncharacterized protein n=1 Tax=Cymbomonas tetramitiformis TaxID=36881 RepID=A0AAE0F0U1_9CHLO|nr:hypothetical protein CYMTET_42602 [Cymbomonas tetramitiformis]
MSQAATVDFQVQRLQRKHPERQEVGTTIVPVNRPAKLASLGVDIEEVLRVLKHTHFNEIPSDSPEPARSFKSTSTRNYYAILTTDESEDTGADGDEDPTPTPPTQRNAPSQAPRPTQREHAVRVQDLLEQTRRRDVTRKERKQRKLAKRKQAKLRRRSGSGNGGDTSPSTSTEDNSSATTLSTSCPSSDESTPSQHSLPSSRKGGRQRGRQARARQRELQLQEETELREREATTHELQLQALRANMQRVAEESAELQKRLLDEMRQEVRDVAATATLEQQRQQAEAQRASEAAAALAEEVRREHVQQMRAASEALEHQQAQALLLRPEETKQQP